jgi:hypothetical protein
MAKEKYDYEKRREKRLERYNKYLFQEAQKQLPKVEQKKLNLQTSFLTDEEQEYFEVMQKCIHFRSQFYSPEQVRKIIMKESGYSYAMVCQAFGDAERLFGDAEIVNKPAMVRTLAEYLHRAIQIAAEADEKYIEQAQIIIKATEALKSLYQLDKDANQVNPEDVMPKTQYIFQAPGVVNNVVQNLPPKYVPGNDEE